MQQYYSPFAGYQIPAETEVTGKLLGKLLADYIANKVPRYVQLRKAYEGDYAILYKDKKAEFKPDKRLVANYAKEIVDSMTGYFLGNPVRITGDDDAAVERLELWGAYNDSDDLDAELSKTCDIYGSALEFMWRDAQAMPRSSCETPMNGFIIFDDTVAHTVLYAVRFFLDANRYDDEIDTFRGTLYTPKWEIPFEWATGEANLGEAVLHGFPDVPVVEYINNEERTGLFEGVLSLIDAHNEAISEKANDVDYYADAYLEITGALIDNDTLKKLRDSRIINIAGQEGQAIKIDFLSKPDADATQEHLIDRLEKLIFEMSMVADMSAENFGTASGIAIRYRLLAMSNIAIVKERKFRRSLSRRWRLVLGYAVGNSGVSSNGWQTIRATFTRNLPNNLLEETQIAGNLSGVVSKETQLSTLSVVDNPAREIERMNDEAEERAAALAQPRMVEVGIE